MPERVTRRNSISLNAVRFPVVGRVNSTAINQYPQRLVIGAIGPESNPLVSTITWNDWRGGIGLWEFGDASGLNRSWFSWLQQKFPGHLVLRRDITQTTRPSPTPQDPDTIGELNGTIYASWGGAVHSYNNGTDSWGSSLHSLTTVASDVINVNMGGTEYIVWGSGAAGNGAYGYYDGSTFTNDTKSTEFLTFWDDRLWGINRSGQLWYAVDIGTEVDDALLPVPINFVTSLFVGPDAGNEPIIYAGTRRGLYAHDAANNRFIKTNVTFPEHPNGCEGAVAWGPSIYLPRGQSLFEYTPSTGVVRNVGIDVDDGLPGTTAARSWEDATIRQVIVAENDLYARVNSPGSKRNLVIRWSGRGWEVVDDIGSAIQWIHASDAYGVYRLWYGTFSAEIFFLQLFANESNPDQDTTTNYEDPGTDPSGWHETPWFHANQPENDKLALRLLVESRHPSSSETIDISYATDYADIDFSNDTNFTSLTQITSTGLTIFEFPNSTTPTGIAFRTIKFRIKMDRGGTSTNTPDLRKLTLEFLPKLKPKWAFEFTVDLSNRFGGRTPLQLRAALLTAIESTTAVELTFRDDTGNTRNFYVNVTAGDGSESTGHDEAGTTVVRAIEV